MGRLRDRLGNNTDSHTDTSKKETDSFAKRNSHIYCQKKKNTKYILVGIILTKETKMHVHMRAKAGRGKRTAMLNNALNKQYIIKECLNLVSIDGESQHGKLKEMDVKLKDFHLKPLEDKETTLGDMIDKAKLKFVYVYLRTRQKKQLSDDEGLE